MAAKIIQLKDFQKNVRLSNGASFPKLYRVRGKYFADRGDVLLAGEEDAPITYTLSNEDDCGYADPSWEVMTKPDEKIETGILVIRRHLSPEAVTAYLDAVADAGMLLDGTAFNIFRGDGESFTLFHRKNVQEGVPSPLIAYINKVPTAPDFAYSAWRDSYHIIRPDGTFFQDEDVIYPTNEE